MFSFQRLLIFENTKCTYIPLFSNLRTGHVFLNPGKCPKEYTFYSFLGQTPGFENTCPVLKIRKSAIQEHFVFSNLRNLDLENTPRSQIRQMANLRTAQSSQIRQSANIRTEQRLKIKGQYPKGHCPCFTHHNMIRRRPSDIHEDLSVKRPERISFSFVKDIQVLV